MLSSGNGVVADGVQNLGKEPVVHGVVERTRLCVVGIIRGCQLNYVRNWDMHSLIACLERHLAMAHHAGCNSAATIGRVIVINKANLTSTQISQLTAGTKFRLHSL